MENIVTLWNNLNPWKTAAFVFFIMFLITCMILVIDKFKRVIKAIYEFKEDFFKRQEAWYSEKFFKNIAESVGIISNNVSEFKRLVEQVLKEREKLN